MQNMPYLKVRSNWNKLLLSLVSASMTSCLRLSYITESKNARSWNLIGLDSMYFSTCLFKNIGHNSFCSKPSPIKRPTFLKALSLS